MKEQIYWTRLTYKTWNLYIAATNKGLCYVGAQDGPYEDFLLWAKKHLPKSQLVEDDKKLLLYRSQLIEYFDGERKEFTIPFDFSGTDFQKDVWKALCNIPYGETVSYSDIANAIKNPKAVRAVGGAIGKNSLTIIVPCHRVIGKNGSLTGFSGGIEMKKRLLALENEFHPTIFDNNYDMMD
jgi:methylated-DNA-[protein]-cysteine S-methyltransferase